MRACDVIIELTLAGRSICGDTLMSSVSTLFHHRLFHLLLCLYCEFCNPIWCIRFSPVMSTRIPSCLPGNGDKPVIKFDCYLCNAPSRFCNTVWLFCAAFMSSHLYIANGSFLFFNFAYINRLSVLQDVLAEFSCVIRCYSHATDGPCLRDQLACDTRVNMVNTYDFGNINYC